MKPFLAALRFLTILPIHISLSERDLERAPTWFPLVGLIIGLAVAIIDAFEAHLGLKPLGVRGFPDVQLQDLALDHMPLLAHGSSHHRKKRKGGVAFRWFRIRQYGGLMSQRTY